MKENLGNRICYGNTSLRAETLGTRSAKHCWGTAHFQSTKAGFPLASLVGPRSCAGLVLMQPVLAGQRRPWGLAEGINLAMGFQKLKSSEVDPPMPSLSVSAPPAASMTTSYSSTYLSNELLE